MFMLYLVKVRAKMLYSEWKCNDIPNKFLRQGYWRNATTTYRQITGIRTINAHVRGILAFNFTKFSKKVLFFWFYFRVKCEMYMSRIKWCSGRQCSKYWASLFVPSTLLTYATSRRCAHTVASVPKKEVLTCSYCLSPFGSTSLGPPDYFV